MPFKLNQDRRHHIPNQKRKVTNTAAYDAALRQRGSLMGQSSGCFEIRLKGHAGMEDGPEHVHAASCEGDDGFVVAFPLASFAVVEGAALVVVERAERGLVEHMVEALVAAVRPTQEVRPAGLTQHRCHAGVQGKCIGGAEAGQVACLGDKLCGEHDPQCRAG